MSSQDETPEARAQARAQAYQRALERSRREQLKGRAPEATPAQPSRLNPAGLARLIPLFRDQLRDAEERAQRALAEVEHLRQVIGGLEGLSGGAPRQVTLPFLVSPEAAEPEDDGPRGQEAVRRVMLAAPDRVWPLNQITREIIRRGWINPDAKVPTAAIRAATQRLAAAELAEKVDPGHYRLTEKGRRAPD